MGDNGYTTCNASSTSEGLAADRKERPDLNHPRPADAGCMGPALLPQAAQDKVLLETPVDGITGIDGDHAIKDAMAFMAKPFDADKLLGIVKKTIG